MSHFKISELHPNSVVLALDHRFVVVCTGAAVAGEFHIGVCRCTVRSDGFADERNAELYILQVLFQARLLGLNNLVCSVNRRRVGTQERTLGDNAVELHRMVVLDKRLLQAAVVVQEHRLLRNGVGSLQDARQRAL